MNNIRKFENFHILLWLIKDLCWVTLSEKMGVFMIIPTISFAIYITWISRSDASELAHNLAVCFWICANSIWMIGEFFYDDSFRPQATVFFVIGLLCIAWHYYRIFFNKVRYKAR
jgi:hypothetical protein